MLGCSHDAGPRTGMSVDKHRVDELLRSTANAPSEKLLVEIILELEKLGRRIRELEIERERHGQDVTYPRHHSVDR
jgi:hypothetical protein